MQLLNLFFSADSTLMKAFETHYIDAKKITNDIDLEDTTFPVNK